MSAISNNTILADNEPSVCIPRVFANIDRKRIHNVFQTIFGPDVVSQIDMVKKVSETGEEYSRVFVHFTKWPKTMYAQQVRQKLLSGDKVKVVYDEPWFWHMSASRVERPQQRHREVSAPYIDLNESSSTASAGAGRKMERERTQRDASPLVPRQVAMKGGAGAGYQRQDTRRERDQDYHHHHQERERHQHYPEDRHRHYENDSSRNRGNDYYAHDSRRPQQQHHYREDYAPRYEDQRQRTQQHHQPHYRNKSKVFTPRTPEIKEWTEKKEAPPAPMKSQGRRPVLMLDSEEESKTSRKLDLDDTPATATADDEAKVKETSS